MEGEVLTLADIGVTTLHIGYNEDRSKAVVEINRVDKDVETLSKLKTLKDNFKFRPTGQKSVYEIESIETYEHFYRLFCIRVEDDDAPKVSAERNDDGSVTFSVPTVQGFRIKEDAVPVFVSHGDEPSERGEQGGVDDILVLTDKVDVLRVNLFKHCSKEIELKCNDKFGPFVEYWQSLPVPRKILFRMEKDSPDVYMIESLYFKCGRGFIRAQYIGNMCDFKRVDAMPKKKGQLPVVVDLYKELDLVKLFKNMNGEFTIEVKCNDKMEVFNRKYAECKPVFEALTLEGSKYFTIKCKGHEIIDTAFWTLEELNPTGAGVVFNERVMQKLTYERLLKDDAGEPKLVGKLCSSMYSAPTTRRINIVKLNKVTRL